MNSFSKKYPKTSQALKYTGSAIKVAKQAYSMARIVASIVNSEKKYTDKAFSVNLGTTASITCLTNQAQGDTNITRNGNSIALKSLQIDGTLGFDTAAPSEQIRMMLIRDNDNLSGTAPTTTEILESSSVVALRNKNTPKRFTVLYDKLYTASSDKLVRHITYFKKFKMLKDKKGNPTVSQKCLYDGTAEADYTRGHIFLLILSNTADGSTLSNFNGNSRIRFYDN